MFCMNLQNCEVWIMPNHAGMGITIGKDFMIPAEIRLDLFNATAKLPDEIAVPLLESTSESRRIHAW